MIYGNQHNNTHPLAYAAGGLGPNPNILDHDAAMKAVDSDKFEISMAGNLTKMWENKNYEIIKGKMCVKDTPSSDQYGHTKSGVHITP